MSQIALIANASEYALASRVVQAGHEQDWDSSASIRGVPGAIKYTLGGNTISAKFGRTTAQVYYFNRDILADGWECISDPKGLAEPQSNDWPSAQRSRDRG